MSPIAEGYIREWNALPFIVREKVLLLLNTAKHHFAEPDHEYLQALGIASYILATLVDDPKPE